MSNLDLSTLNTCEEKMKKVAILTIALFFLSSPIAAVATDVGGIINTDTTWDAAKSPYTIISEVQIAEGATLTIAPGVVIEAPQYSGGAISVWGTLRAVGTSTSNIIFNYVTLQQMTGVLPTIVLQYVQFNYGEFNILGKTGDEERIFVIRDSKLQGLGYSGFGGLTEGSFIERNIFTGCNALYIGTYHSLTQFIHPQKLYIRNNKFVDPEIYVCPSCNFGSITIYGGHPEFVSIEHNSFLSTDKLALTINLDTNDAEFMAANNFWNTTDTDVIDAMIYDRNDNLNNSGYVTYVPFLTKPDPDTPGAAAGAGYMPWLPILLDD